ncbi:hypothetical protein AB4084_31065, partial [Lysobacter sp. 2RAB21]
MRSPEHHGELRRSATREGRAARPSSLSFPCVGGCEGMPLGYEHRQARPARLRPIAQLRHGARFRPGAPAARARVLIRFYDAAVKLCDRH